jgi:hypothetical protein
MKTAHAELLFSKRRTPKRKVRDPIDDGVTADPYREMLKQALSPEKLLMLAVLEDAIEHCQRFVLGIIQVKDKRYQGFDNPWYWLESEDDEWPFSFRAICAELQISPEYILAGMKNWRKLALRNPEKSRKSWKPIRREDVRKAIVIDLDAVRTAYKGHHRRSHKKKAEAKTAHLVPAEE